MSHIEIKRMFNLVSVLITLKHCGLQMDNLNQIINDHCGEQLA
jgi:hypothetical protein